MAIDWTKPIRLKNGTALRCLHELQHTTALYPMVCVATSEDGNEYLLTYTKDGLYNQDNKKGSPSDAENIPATEQAQPEIDWAGEVQMSCQERDMWEDFIPLFKNKDHVYGYTVRDGVERALVWHFTNFRFRNKPAEPKRVKGWLGIYRAMEGFHACAELRTWRKDLPMRCGEDLIACFEIDVPEGQGLEGEK